MTERKVWGAFLLLALAWGTSFMFIKLAVQTLQPLTLVTLRLLIGWVGLGIIMRWRGISLPRRRETWGHLAVIGLINVALPFVLITWAESGSQGLDSGVASILNSTVPLFSIVVAGLVLRMETVSMARVVGLVVGFAGVVLLMSRGATAETGSVWPSVAVVGAALCYALGTIYARRSLRGLNPITLAAGQLFLADVAVLTLALLLEDFSRQTFTWTTIGSLLWLGLLGSCMAYILYFFVLEEWGATRTTLVTYLVPVVGVTAGVLLLGERLDWRMVGGGLLILVGVLIVNGRLRLRRLSRQGTMAD
ncbi:MAG: DMT family transporter, partial [Chloroflexota bacterium]